MASNATILRVSNVPGSSAPYTSIQDAHDAASEGDTIMVDGSSISYGSIEIKKQLVLIGPGYWLTENGIISEGATFARINNLTIAEGASGTIIQGFRIWENLNDAMSIRANNCVITRCSITGGSANGNGIVFYGNGMSGGVVHQNIFFNSCVAGSSQTKWADPANMTSNVQVTNNIFAISGWSKRAIVSFTNSYIAYNSIITDDFDEPRFSGCSACTIEHNIIPNKDIWYKNTAIVDNNEWSDNYVGGVLDVDGNKIYSTYTTDKDIRDAELAMSEGLYGAFAGDSPYVISGIPAGPVIEDLIVPTTVEKGSTMNVTIKVGIQK